MTPHRVLIGLSVLLAAGASAQTVKVKTKDAKVQVGTTGVDVDTGHKTQVKVDTSGVRIQTGGDVAVEVREEEGSETREEVKVQSSTDVEIDHDDDGTFEVSGMGIKVSHVCKANEDVAVEGQGHQIWLKGSCRTIKVEGMNNTVISEKVAFVKVEGTGNHVTFRSGLNGNKPKISNSGLNNTALQQH
jgi:Protein of unknown function (DUF3060)